MTLAFTGIRIGEAAQLRWSEVDLEARQLRIVDESANAAGGQDVLTTKNRKSRVIPLHTEVVTALQALPGEHHGKVFHGPRGGILKPDTVRNIFEREVLAALKSKFPSSGFERGRIHSFRHLFCSTCFRHGIPEADIRLMLGHADSQMVAHYRHLGEDEHLKQIDKLRPLGRQDAT